MFPRVPSIAQNRFLQLSVKAFQLIKIINGLLRMLGLQLTVPGTDLKYQLRYVDSLFLAKTIFEGDEYAAIRGEAGSISSFIDLGCNVGFFPLYLCKIRRDRKIKGICIDANPAMITEIEANLALNQLSEVTAIHGLAEAGKTGALREFWVTQSSSSSTSDLSSLGTKFGSTNVHAPLLDPLVEFHSRLGDQRIDILKVDIEGSELNFLSSHPKLVEQTDRIILEFHKPKVTSAAVRALLEPAGFSLKYIRDDLSEPWGIVYMSRENSRI